MWPAKNYYQNVPLLNPPHRYQGLQLGGYKKRNKIQILISVLLFLIDYYIIMDKKEFLVNKAEHSACISF